MRKVWMLLLLLLTVIGSAFAADPTQIVAWIYNTTTTAANTNIVGTSITPANLTNPGVQGIAYRVTVACITTNSVFNLVSSDGTTTRTMSFNGGTTLTAGCVYTFVFGATAKSPAGVAMTYNFQGATLTTWDYLLVEAVRDGSL